MSSSPLDAAFAFARHADWSRVVPAARQALAADPSDATAHALLGLALAHLEQPKEAVDASRRAVALDPELPFAHHALGLALLQYDDASGAERAAREGLRLDPDGDAHALLGQSLAKQARWQEALEAANGGLDVDAEHAGCANLRAMALGVLGRGAEAESAVRGVLALDPDDAGAHANRGWLFLRQSNPEAALESFREALRLEPTLDWARAGVVEALKARKGLYRIVLRYSLWMGALTTRTQWMLIVGLFLGMRALRVFASRNPEWSPVVGAILGAYLVFVVLTWIAGPLSNLLLRLNRFGRLALSRDETLASNLIGGCLAAAVLALILLMATRESAWLMVAATSLLMLIPIGGAFQGHGTRAWRPLATAVIVLAGCAVAASLLAFVRLDLAAWPFIALLLGSFLFGWVANYLLLKYR